MGVTEDLYEIEEEEDLKELMEWTKKVAPKRFDSIYSTVLIRHFFSPISLDPIKKIRMICEIKFMLGNKPDNELHNIYKVSVSLLSTTQNNLIGWAFPRIEDNYKKYIKPWAGNYIPDFYFVNKLDSEIKSEKLIDPETKSLRSEWERFFIITSEIGVTDVALLEMKGMFSVYAMPIAMREYADMIENFDSPRK